MLSLTFTELLDKIKIENIKAGSKMKNKNIIIISLCIILLIMIVGYSAFSTKLNINSSSTVTSNWDIEITNVAFKSKVGYAEEVASSFDKTRSEERR